MAAIPSFLLRVELIDADEEDYERLNSEMERRQFSKSIPDANRNWYKMPSGEYFFQGRKSAAYICEMGEQAAIAIGKKAHVLAAEVMMVAFDLEPDKARGRSHSPFD